MEPGEAQVVDGVTLAWHSGSKRAQKINPRSKEGKAKLAKRSFILP